MNESLKKNQKSIKIMIGALLLIFLAGICFVIFVNIVDPGPTTLDRLPDFQSQSPDQVKGSTGSNSSDTVPSPSGTDGGGNNILRGE